MRGQGCALLVFIGSTFSALHRVSVGLLSFCEFSVNSLLLRFYSFRTVFDNNLVKLVISAPLGVEVCN